jgi:hypothetical protein
MSFETRLFIPEGVDTPEKVNSLFSQFVSVSSNIHSMRVEDEELILISDTELPIETIEALQAIVPEPLPVADKYKYKIYSLVDQSVRDLSHNMIDFRRHLLPNISLIKKLTTKPDFRPDFADYEHEGVKYARLKWTFVNIPNSAFMYSRKEEIAYYLNDGTLGEYFTKKLDVYDMQNNAYDRITVINERKQSRISILDDIKTICISIIQALNPSFTEQDVYDNGGLFWSHFSASIDSYKETASNQFALVMANEQGEEFNWLDTPLPGAGGATLRQYIVAKVS